MEERQMTQGLWGTVAKGALGLTCCCSLVVLGVLTLLALGLYAIFF